MYFLTVSLKTHQNKHNFVIFLHTQIAKVVAVAMVEIDAHSENVALADYHLSLTPDFYDEFCRCENDGEKWK